MNPQHPPQNPGRTWIVAGGIVAVVLVAGVVAIMVTLLTDRDPGPTRSDRDRESASEVTTPDPPPETGSVEVAGTPLPTLEDNGGMYGDDPAVGMPFPTITAQNIEGDTVELRANGPQIIVLVAHWCPVCQEEVPAIAEQLASQSWPADVTLTLVSTSESPDRGNHPPSEWLAEEGFTGDDVVVDSRSNEIAGAVGLTAFPTFIFVDGDGTVLMRASGSLPEGELLSLADSLSGT